MGTKGATVEIDEDSWKTLVMLMLRSNSTADKQNLELVEEIIQSSDEKQRIYGIVKEFVENGMQAPRMKTNKTGMTTSTLTTRTTQNVCLGAMMAPTISQRRRIQ